MANEPGFARADLSSLRLAVVGGAPMPAALLETWQRRGVELVEGYGLTEAAPNGPLRRQALPLRRPVPFGRGRAARRRPERLRRLLANETATRAALTAEGRLRTGDVAELDDEGR